MTAKDYPVTTPYGFVPGYPLHNGFHQGIDYGCPVGTPVVVNGVTIGLSGNTGYTFGPHLHLGKWVGGVVQNPLSGGFQFNSAVVTEINEDSDNGKYVRIQGDGASWVYLHLSDNSKVKVGQTLQGANMGLNYDQVNKICYMATGLQADTADAFKNNVGLELDVVLANFMAYKETRDKQLRADSFEPDQKRIKELEAQVGQPATELKPGVYQVK